MTAVLCYIAQGYSPIKIPFASGGMGNSRMFAHDSAAAFLSIYKKTTTKKNGVWQQSFIAIRSCGDGPIEF